MMADITYCVAQCDNRACPYHISRAIALRMMFASQADRSESCEHRIIPEGPEILGPRYIEDISE